MIKEIMERQIYPVRHYTPGGEIIKPYDITSWSLPLHRGVKVTELIKVHPGLEEHLVQIKDEFTLASVPDGDYGRIVFPAERNESWKLAFLAKNMGMEVGRLTTDTQEGEIFLTAGSFVVESGKETGRLLEEARTTPIYLPDSMKPETVPFDIPRIALVETWYHDMEAGWTRFVFDTYHIPYQILHPGDFEKTDLASLYDVIVFTDEEKSILMTGKYKSGDDYIPTNYPPEYTKGMGDKGMANLMTFLDQGGIILAWGESTGLFAGPLSIKRGEDEKEDFKLPFNDISSSLKAEKVYCPGSLLKVDLTENHPLTWGMPLQVGIFSRGTPVFSTQVPVFDMDRRVMARYPEKEILVSGYCENEEKLENKSVMIWLRKGKGQLVLYGFSPLFRASTQASYKLFFNALLLPRINEQVTRF
jgi:hypothetical protein